MKVQWKITLCSPVKNIWKNLTVDEIENMSYLTGEKSKQEKIKDIIYSKLEMQEYLADGDRQKY